MRASKKSRQKLRAELKRIKALHREWNALPVAERAWIARATPDLSLFFRRHIGAEAPGATAQVIDLLEARRLRISEAQRLGVSAQGEVR